MGFIIGGQATAAGETCFIATLSGPVSEQANGAVTDSSGNIYICGGNTAQEGYFVAKYNSSGTIQWQRTLGTQGFNARSIAIDSSSNIYLGGNSGIGLVKYDSSGNKQWQKTVGNSSAAAVAVDSANYIYVAGEASDGTDVGFISLAKFDSTGAIQWQRSLKDASNFYRKAPVKITTDSSNNVYIVGWYQGGTASGSTTVDAVIAKYDSTGTLQWQRQFGNSSGNIGTGIVTDSSGNVYVGAYQQGGGYFIAKYNSSGTRQWQRSLSSTGNGDVNLSSDDSGNIYLATSASISGLTKFVIVKYDSSGTLQWQRQFGPTAWYAECYGIFVKNSIMYITGKNNAATSGGNNDIVFAKLPTDGTMTGTYTVGGYNFSYASATALTDGAGSWSDAALSLTGATSTLTVATPSLTANTATATPTYTAASTTTGTSTGAVIPSGITMGGTGSGMVISSYVPPPPPSTLEYLVVAGGGGAGNFFSGGGGAGGYRAGSTSVTAGTPYAITVGAGGIGRTAPEASFPGVIGYNGSNSVFSSITAIGGGGGGNTYATGLAGGSGGGGGAQMPGGAGTAGQGNAGGTGRIQSGDSGGGGGGGAGAAGSNAQSLKGGDGGIGIQNSITGTPTYYAGGGGGMTESGSGTQGVGGLGGGGNAYSSATPNTGGGGGGSQGSGGSGIVVVRYPDTYAAATSTTGSPDITVAGGYRIYKWTTVGSGSITF